MTNLLDPLASRHLPAVLNLGHRGGEVSARLRLWFSGVELCCVVGKV